MANQNFPGPNINRLIETDPQIVKVSMVSTEFGSRPSAMPKNTKNAMTLEHVSGKGR